MTNKKFEAQRYRKVFIFICAATAVLSSGWIFAAERADIPKPARYRIFSLKHISAEQGEEYLTEAEIICTVSRLPSPNTLLITAQPRELIRISAILKLVDAEEKFVVKTILPTSEAKGLPSNDKISAELGNISIGTFSEPPAGDAPVKAIIDIHNDAVVAVAPAGKLEKIISAIEKLQSSSVVPRDPDIDALEIAEQLRTTSPKPDELFSKLLGSIAAAEKKTAKPQAAKIPDSNDIELVEKEEPKPEPKPKALPEQLPVKPVETKVPELKEVAVLGTPYGEKPEPEPEPEPEPVNQEVRAAKSYEPEPIDGGEEMLDLNLPEKLNIIDLLSLAGKYLHLDYMYDPAKVRGDVALKLQGPIKVKDLYPLLESVLKFRGLVMTRKGNLVTIVPVAEARNIDPVLYTDAGVVQRGNIVITRIFELQHIDTASAKNLLTGMKLGVQISDIAKTGTLIVTGYTYRMARIEELLTMVDKPGKPRQFRFRQLKYTMAKILAPKIKTLAEQLGTISITVSAPPAPASPARRGRAAPKPPTSTPTPAKPTVYLDADERTNRILMIGLDEQLTVVNELIDTLDVEQQDLRTLRLYDIQYVGPEEVVAKLGELGIISSGRTTTAPRPARTAKAAAPPTVITTKEPLAEEPQVVIIESTNSLLVNATAQQHIKIATIIGYVDSRAEQTAIPYVVYPLENQDPVELAEVLNQLVLKTITEKGKDDKIVRTTTTKKIEEDVFIIPEPKTYSLIVYANKKNQQWVSSLIKQLDEYRPQVLLDVTLVEITKNDEFTFDLDLVSKLPHLVPGETMVSGSGDGSLIGAIVSPFPAGRVTELRSKGGTGTGFYTDRHIQALLDVMDKKGYGRVLARPKLLVNDNEEGTIKSAELQYVARERVSTIAGTTATTSVQDRSIVFESYPAGIELTIQPHISKGDQLRLHIILNRTDFREAGPPVVIGGDTIDKPLDTVSSDITTVVTVPDGTTIILGGMERLNQTKSGTKIPILGDIPIIGGLFKSTSNTDVQSKLYVFVKAHILRPGEETHGVSDIEVVSAKNRAMFEKYEKEMQEYQDWPGIKPEPMDPLRVLEID